MHALTEMFRKRAQTLPPCRADVHQRSGSAEVAVRSVASIVKGDDLQRVSLQLVSWQRSECGHQGSYCQAWQGVQMLPDPPIEDHQAVRSDLCLVRLCRRALRQGLYRAAPAFPELWTRSHLVHHVSENACQERPLPPRTCYFRSRPQDDLAKHQQRPAVHEGPDERMPTLPG